MSRLIFTEVGTVSLSPNAFNTHQIRGLIKCPEMLHKNGKTHHRYSNIKLRGSVKVVTSDIFMIPSHRIKMILHVWLRIQNKSRLNKTGLNKIGKLQVSKTCGFWSYKYANRCSSWSSSKKLKREIRPEMAFLGDKHSAHTEGKCLSLDVLLLFKIKYILRNSGNVKIVSINNSKPKTLSLY